MKRFFKIFIITLAVIGLLAVTITALLFVPSFQQLLKREAVESLSDKLQTEVNLDSVSFSIITGDVSLIGLDVKDQKGEPMLHANVLKGKMYFWKLFSDNIDIDDITLDGAEANLYRVSPDSVPNFQFLLDAFKGDSTQTDTTSKKKMSFDIKNVQVSNMKIHWADRSDSSSALDFKLAKAEYNQADSTVNAKKLEMQYHGQDISLENAEYDIANQNVLIENLRAKEGGNVASIATLKCENLKDIDIEDFRYFTDNDLPRKNAGKPMRGSFDSGHMKIVGHAHLTLLNYKNNDIRVHVDRLWADERESGLRIDTMSCLIKTDTKTAQITDLYLKDQNTVIRIPNIDVKGLKKDDKTHKSDLSFSTSQIHVKTKLSDISRPFSPALADFTTMLELTTSMTGNKDSINFHDINVHTLDNRLKIKANGRIDSLSAVKQLKVHFDVKSMTTHNNITEQIVGHFRIKPTMMGIVRKLGDIQFTGMVDIPYMSQQIQGRLVSNVGPVRFNILLENHTRYLQGMIVSDSINLGKLVDNPNLGNLALETEFKFDIAGKNSARRLGRKVTSLPAGFARGVAKEARYRFFTLRNTYFDIKSDGTTATGSVRLARALVDVLCDFSFTNTDFKNSLQAKPSLRFHKWKQDSEKEKAAQKPIVNLPKPQPKAVKK